MKNINVDFNGEKFDVHYTIENLSDNGFEQYLVNVHKPTQFEFYVTPAGKNSFGANCYRRGGEDLLNNYTPEKNAISAHILHEELFKNKI